ncbi:MAG: putative phosphoslipid binding protein [Myxococcales bacterium]|nr:putative phosphoslipid binding protein [Myxococcales bacterium]
MRIANISAAVLVTGMLIVPVSQASPAHQTVVRKTKTSRHVETTVETKKDEAGAPAADDTGINKRDRDKSEPTADQQSNGSGDVALTTEIRRGLMDDKTLSTNAHNVKIIVQNGDVTLKGPVASAAEKEAVERVATRVAGKNKGKVNSELAIAH